MSATGALAAATLSATKTPQVIIALPLLPWNYGTESGRNDDTERH